MFLTDVDERKEGRNSRFDPPATVAVVVLHLYKDIDYSY